MFLPDVGRTGPSAARERETHKEGEKEEGLVETGKVMGMHVNALGEKYILHPSVASPMDGCPAPCITHLIEALLRHELQVRLVQVYVPVLWIGELLALKRRIQYSRLSHRADEWDS